MFQLRYYQQQAKDGVKKSFMSGNKRVVLCKPTGAGKTVTFVSIVADAIKKGARTMILCDRKELIGQAKDKINDLGLNPTIIAPKHKQIVNNCYLASVDTLRRRTLPEIDLLIVDEAHKQTFDKMLHKYVEFCNPYIIGATATPHRSGNQNCMSEIYQDLIEPINTQQLIDANFLVQARTFASKQDYSDVKKRGADFDTSALYEKFNQTKLYDGVIDNYLKFSPGKKAICFNVNVEHSIQMVQKFRDAGIRAVHLDGKTPDAERKRILRDYKKENFVLSNCSVLTTGFDEPSIETVIVNRATMSLPLWLQMTGRGSRLYTGKKDFTIIDQGANVYRHGMWEEERNWSLYKKKKKKKSDGVAPVKVCPACESINHASARVCKECKTPFEIKEKKLQEAEFVEVKKNRGLKNVPNPKTASRQELSDYAKQMGYKQGWVFQQLKDHGRI